MSKVVVGNKNLYIFYEYWSDAYRPIKGLPRSIETLIKDSYKKNSYAGSWSRYFPDINYPPKGNHILPSELFLEVSAKNKISFDFLGVGHGIKCFSEEMWIFIQKHLHPNDDYDIAKLIISSKSGKIIETQKKYFAVRFLKNDNNFIDFKNSELFYSSYDNRKYKFYPKMQIKEGFNKKIFNLSDPLPPDKFDPNDPISLDLRRTLVFTQEIKDLITQNNFVTPSIFAISDLYMAYKDIKDYSGMKTLPLR